MKSPQLATDRQMFVVLKRVANKSIDDIRIEYQQKFNTKTKPSREYIRDILALYGLWPPPHV